MVEGTRMRSMAEIDSDRWKIVDSLDTRWILFAKRSSRDNCLGKGRILDCFHIAAGTGLGGGNKLHIDMMLNGVRFIGNIEEIGQEEEE